MYWYSLCIEIYNYIHYHYKYKYIQYILRKNIQTRVSSFPGLISVARVNEYRTTDVTRVLKGQSAEFCQNACGVMKKQKIFCSHQCCPDCPMNKSRAYISRDMCFFLPKTHQCGSVVYIYMLYILYIYIYIYIYIYVICI